MWRFPMPNQERLISVTNKLTLAWILFHSAIRLRVHRPIETAGELRTRRLTKTLCVNMIHTSQRLTNEA